MYSHFRTLHLCSSWYISVHSWSISVQKTEEQYIWLLQQFSVLHSMELAFLQFSVLHFSAIGFSYGFIPFSAFVGSSISLDPPSRWHGVSRAHLSLATTAYWLRLFTRILKKLVCWIYCRKLSSNKMKNALHTVKEILVRNMRWIGW